MVFEEMGYLPPCASWASFSQIPVSIQLKVTQHCGVDTGNGEGEGKHTSPKLCVLFSQVEESIFVIQTKSHET